MLEVVDSGFKLLELAPNISVEDVKNATEGNLVVCEHLKEISI